MYKVGDLVMYGIHGACRITEEEVRTVDKKPVSYFVLTPLEQPGARFLVPMHNENALKKLRPVLTRSELEALLQSDQVRQDAWIEDENRRKQRYRELIGLSDRTALLQMVRTLHKHRQSQIALGRKLHQCDDNFLKDAQRLIETEFSLTLGMEPALVGSYIQTALDAE